MPAGNRDPGVGRAGDRARGSAPRSQVAPPAPARDRRWTACNRSRGPGPRPCRGRRDHDRRVTRGRASGRRSRPRPGKPHSSGSAVARSRRNGAIAVRHPSGNGGPTIPRAPVHFASRPARPGSAREPPRCRRSPGGQQVERAPARAGKDPRGRVASGNLERSRRGSCRVSSRCSPGGFGSRARTPSRVMNSRAKVPSSSSACSSALKPMLDGTPVSDPMNSTRI